MSALPDGSNRTFNCSVALLQIAEYSRRPVAEQIRLKDRFNTVLQEAIRDVAVNDRIILDTGDGAAISFLGDPGDALSVAVAIREASAPAATAADPAPLPIRLGVNLGPVRLVRDVNGQPNIIGDGISVAQRIMGFADPGQILVSRSYYESVSRLGEGYAGLFRFEGSRTDSHVRAHDVYAVVRPAPNLGTLRARRNAPRGDPGAEARRPPRERWTPLGVLVVAILAAAVGIRFLKQQGPEPAPPAASSPPIAVPPATQAVPATKPPLPAASAPARPGETGAAETMPPRAPRPAKKPEPAQPPAAAGVAQVVIAVHPWGEIYVDGRLQGVSPPLRTLEVPPGRHTIEVRNTTFPPYTEVIVVGADERVRIRHRFSQEANP